jgi:hypothetical protein
LCKVASDLYASRVDTRRWASVAKFRESALTPEIAWMSELRKRRCDEERKGEEGLHDDWIGTIEVRECFVS